MVAKMVKSLQQLDAIGRLPALRQNGQTTGDAGSVGWDKPCLGPGHRRGDGWMLWWREDLFAFGQFRKRYNVAANRSSTVGRASRRGDAFGRDCARER